MTDKQKYQGKHLLLTSDRRDFCLGGSPNERLTAREIKRGAFAPCRWETNQVSFFYYFLNLSFRKFFKDLLEI